MIRSGQTRAAPMKGPRTVKCKAKGCMRRIVPDPANPRVTWCSDTCLVAVALAAGAARKAKLAKEARTVLKERKEKAKRPADHIAEAQTAFNAYCRYRDRNQQCISCDVHLPSLAGVPGGAIDCGHFRSRGSAPHLRFDERNAHGQCKKCNRYKSGNVTEYRWRLIARIGLDAVEALEADQEPRRYTVDELIAIKTLYRLKLKALKST